MALNINIRHVHSQNRKLQMHAMFNNGCMYGSSPAIHLTTNSATNFTAPPAAEKCAWEGKGVIWRTLHTRALEASAFWARHHSHGHGVEGPQI